MPTISRAAMKEIMMRGSVADLHSPEELLAGALALAVSDEPHVNRAVVLEALTALEAYVESTVFDLLRNRLDPLLVQWLRDKTRMDFDSRLGVLIPAATGVEIDKGAQLWSRYKKAKQIRNKVTHSGRKVSAEEAKEVIKTVYDWISYLGTTSEIDLALYALKRHIQSNRAPFAQERFEDVLTLIKDFFRLSPLVADEVDISGEVGLPARRGRRFYVDAVLKFGDRRVAVEIKFYSQRLEDFEASITRSEQQVVPLILDHGFDRVVIILVFRERVPDKLEEIENRHGGKISIIPVSVSNVTDG